MYMKLITSAADQGWRQYESDEAVCCPIGRPKRSAVNLEVFLFVWHESKGNVQGDNPFAFTERECMCLTSNDSQA
jgi:hypothetical protein